MTKNLEALTKNPLVYALGGFLWVVLGYLHNTAMDRQKANTDNIAAIQIEIAVVKSEIKELRKIADNTKQIPVELAEIKASLRSLLGKK